MLLSFRSDATIDASIRLCVRPVSFNNKCESASQVTCATCNVGFLWIKNRKGGICENAISKRRCVVVADVLLARYHIRIKVLVSLMALSVFMEMAPSGLGPDSISRGLFPFQTILEGTSPRFFERVYRIKQEMFMLLAEKLALTKVRRCRRSCLLKRLSVTLR